MVLLWILSVIRYRTAGEPAGTSGKGLILRIAIYFKKVWPGWNFLPIDSLILLHRIQLLSGWYNNPKLSAETLDNIATTANLNDMKQTKLLIACILAAISIPNALAGNKSDGADDRKVVQYPNAHDPVAAYCDGRYYVFTTGMGVMSSEDMVNWRIEDRVFDKIPQWAADKGFRGMPWAPDIQYLNGKWYIYYSYSGFGKNKSAIGVATNKTLNPESPDFGWEDQGMIVESVPGRDEWNAIDANVTLDENGDAWLAFGSFWRGIKMAKLNADCTRLSEPQEWYPVSRRPEGTAPETVSTDTAVRPDPRGLDFDAGNGAVEAPFIFKHDGMYYLFVSFDLCCRGAKSTYNVVVGRSECIHGPYFDKDGVNMMEGGGTVIVKGNGQYAGAGHCAVVTFDGKDYMFMHGYDKDYDYDSRLLVREISWTEDGWPVVNL